MSHRVAKAVIRGSYKELKNFSSYRTFNFVMKEGRHLWGTNVISPSQKKLITKNLRSILSREKINGIFNSLKRAFKFIITHFNSRFNALF